MSTSRGFGLNGQHLYNNITKPMYIDMSFIVDRTDSAGLGIKSLKSNGYVESVFMNTTQTPGVVHGITNPNPAQGYCLVTFKNNFNKYLGFQGGQVITPAAPTTTATTANSVYVITALGTATLAQWQAKGFPKGFTPAVGAVFVATATGTIGGSANVGTPGVQTAFNISVIGDPTKLVANSQIAQYSGAQVMLQFSALTVSGTNSAPTLTMNSYTPAGTNDGATPPIFTGTPATLTGTVSAPTFTSTSAFTATNPAIETVVRLQFRFDGSVVSIDGL